MNKPRGLATLPPERRREIASMGGKKGGKTRHPDKGFGGRRELAVEMGRRGGIATHAKFKNKRVKQEVNWP